MKKDIQSAGEAMPEKKGKYEFEGEEMTISSVRPQSKQLISTPPPYYGAKREKESQPNPKRKSAKAKPNPDHNSKPLF